MDGSNRSAHCCLVIVHAGKKLAKFAGLTDNGTWCMRPYILTTFPSSPPPHCAPQQAATYSHTSSKWQREMCFSKSVRIYLPQFLQFPDCVHPHRSLHSFRLRSRFCRYHVINANKTRGHLPDTMSRSLKNL